MPNRCGPAVLLVAALLTACQPVDTEGTAATSTEGDDGSGCAVTAVVDGDTFRCAIDGQQDERVRLVGVDAPELAHDEGERDECGGQAARRALADLVAGQRVTITTDPAQGERDRYGRRLGYVATSTTRDVGRQLVTEGAARAVFTHPRQDTYERQQRAARAESRGIWRSC